MAPDTRCPPASTSYQTWMPPRRCVVDARSLSAQDCRQTHREGRRYLQGIERSERCCSHHRSGAACAAAQTDAIPIGVGEIADVESVDGLRVLLGENITPRIQYLVNWKDGSPPTWEPVENLADNLLRDFEESWWKSCREGDEETIKKLLKHSSEVLPQCVDSNDRSALHFCAALGKASCCQLLCEAGAEVDYPDKDGYTPLHMAVGYSHVGTVRALLAAGASPEVPDNQGRNVIQLVDSIRDQLPLNPQMAGKRIALEEVSALLTGNLFEEVFPKRILEQRATASGSREFLVQWLDGAEDSWVKESDVADDIIEDYERGFEYAEAESLLKMKMRGDQRLFLVRWPDGCPDSWEFEDHISGELIGAFEREKEGGEPQSAALPGLSTAAAEPVSKRARRRAAKAARRAAAEAGNGSGEAAEDYSSMSSSENTSSESPLAASQNGHQENEQEKDDAESAAFNSENGASDDDAGEVRKNEASGKTAVAA